MNLENWIDPRVRDVRPADVRAYMLATGWQPQPVPRKQVWRFEKPSPANGDPLLLYVPADAQLEDYQEAVVGLITNLAVLEKRFAGNVLNDILQHGATGRETNGQPQLASAIAPTA